jgi:DNA repair protein RadC
MPSTLKKQGGNHEGGTMEKKLLSSKKPVRLKVIRAVYEKITIREGTSDYAAEAVTDSQAVYSLFNFLKQETKEHFIALHLDTKNRILCMDRVSTGTLTGTVIHAREVFKTALLSSAASLLLVHNHPSGDPTPSRDDILITEKLKGAGDIMGIPILDHIIIGEGYVSLKEKGYL